MRIFLGGTCNDSTWRDELIPHLEARGIEYFDPVVEDWTEQCQRAETRMKEDPNTINLFVITSDMKGVYSIAEVMDCVHENPKKTIFTFVPDGFTFGQIKSLNAVSELVRRRHGVVCGFSPESISKVCSNLIHYAEKIEGIPV